MTTAAATLATKHQNNSDTKVQYGCGVPCSHKKIPVKIWRPILCLTSSSTWCYGRYIT